MKKGTKKKRHIRTSKKGKKFYAGKGNPKDKSLPKGWSEAKLGDLLTNEQIKEITKLAKKGELSHKKLVEIIKRDNSKYKGKVIPEYLAYSIEYNLRRFK